MSQHIVEPIQHPSTQNRMAAMAPDLVFWGVFFLLNGLFFLPLYLLNSQETAVVPTFFARSNAQSIVQQLFAWRPNLDPFRINLELLLLTTLWLHVRWIRRPVIHLLCAIFYFLALSYYIYEGIVLSLWQAEPVFYTHFFLAQDGLGFLLENLQFAPWLYVGVAAALVLALFLIAKLTQRLFWQSANHPLSRISHALLLGLTAFALLSAVQFRSALAQPEMVVSSVIYKLERNITESRRVYGAVHAIDDRTIRRAYDYADYTLSETPNIYLIFVESYGSVLYKRPDYKVSYERLLQALETRLEDGDWHATSALSLSPTWGGGSWMAYTSALFGLRIEEHPYYQSLFDQYQSKEYPDLAQWLKGQGYRYYRSSGLSVELKEQQWQRYLNFYGVDDWFRYSDLDYVGQEYGWGPAPPDQYVINFAREQMQAAGQGPFFYFYITQNSHYPWMPIPEVVDDWRTLNVLAPDQEVPADDDIEHQTRRMNYFNSIDYELTMLVDYILREGEADDIFVLVGDHQPPRVSRRDDGWDTPMHIISRNQDLMDTFEQYGFGEGLQIDDIEPSIHHEGFYSMFVRSLLETYGTDPTDLPHYRPEGVIIPTNLAKE